MKYCILLTASINPPNTKGIQRIAVADREDDYFNALKYYIEFGVPIVFCDNSGYESERINKFCSAQQGRIEYLRFISSESHKGKSHGEKEIFDFAHQHSSIIADADYILKLTGRLILENFSDMFAKLQQQDGYVFANFTKQLTFSDSRFFAYKKDFYHQYLQRVLETQLDDSNRFYFERCLARAIHQLMGERDGFQLLPVYPFFKGHNASTNRTYSKSWLGKIKFSAYYRIKLLMFKRTI
jgi:hypothetical protein